MSGRVRQSAPIAVVVAVLGYLCWPYAGEPLPGLQATGAGKPPEIPPALLSPPAETAPDRDPFKPPAAAKPAAPAVGQAEKVSPALPALTQTDPVSLLSGLALNATYVRGDRRVALINGFLYAEGEPLKLSGPTAPPYKVARVYPDKVVLQREGQTLELKYAATESKPAKAAGEGSKPGGARAGSPVGKPEGPALPSAGTTRAKPGKAG